MFVIPIYFYVLENIFLTIINTVNIIYYIVYMYNSNINSVMFRIEIPDSH